MAPPTQPGDRTALLHSRAMITIAESPRRRSVPGSGTDAGGVGTLARPRPAAHAEVAALRRRADRHRAVAAPRAGVPGHCSGARAPEGTAPDCDRRRRLRRRRLVPLPDHRRRPHPRGAVPGDQPLRRRRAGAARAVPGLPERLPRGGAAGRHARARAAGVLASRHQRRRSSTSSGRRSMPATRCSSTALRETARRSSRRPFTTCSTARSPSRTRSKSKATSSGCSIPSIMSRRGAKTTARASPP